MKRRIYIASPYTIGDTAANVARSMTAWHNLVDGGYAPYCPLLSHFLHLHRQRPYAHWLEQDLVWIAVCDGLLRLDGRSSGADDEVAEAQRLGIPVFYTWRELNLHEWRSA